MEKTEEYNLAEPQKASPWPKRFLGLVNISLGATFLVLHFSGRKLVQEEGISSQNDVTSGISLSEQERSIFDDIVQKNFSHSGFKATTKIAPVLQQLEQRPKLQTTMDALCGISGASLIAIGINEIARTYRKPPQQLSKPLIAEGEMSRKIIESRNKNEASMLR